MKHKTPMRRSTVKRGLNGLLRHDFKNDFVFWVEKYSMIATRITVLASMLILYHVNKAVDIGGEEADALFDLDGKEAIKQCFLNVLQENAATLPNEFRQIVKSAVSKMEWPTREGMGNAFNQLFDMYTTNTKTNIKKHAKKHLKKFFRIKGYELNNRMRHQGIIEDDLISAADIDGAVNAMFYQKRFDQFNPIKQRNIDTLIEEAIKIGIPATERLCDVIVLQWFRSIRWLVAIQREIDTFHSLYNNLFRMWGNFNSDPTNNPEPFIPKPPRISNFNAIPLHSCHRKHITIDIQVFRLIANKIGALKDSKGKYGKPINVSDADYKKNPDRWWNRVFFMNKINKMARGEQKFDFHMTTDGVSASITYAEPKKETPVGEDLFGIRLLFHYFKYVLGIDPGLRTWNATCRKDIQNGDEVSYTMDCIENLSTIKILYLLYEIFLFIY